MNIAIFTDNFYPELSGISDSVITLAEQLAARGHKICFCVPKYSAKNFKTAGLPAEELQLGPNIQIQRYASLPFPAGTKQSRFVFPTGLRWLWLKKFQPDVIHTQLFAGVGLEAIAAARALKIPLVGTNHTAISEFVRYSPIRFKWLDNAILKYVSWYYNQCDYVTAPSQSVFDEMQQYGFEKKHQVMPNPMDLKNFTPVKNDAERAAAKKFFGFSNKVMVFAGRLAAEKNIDVTLRALPEIIKAVPEAQFAVAGHGQAEAELKKLAQQLGVSKNFKLVGTLKKSDLAKFYQAGDVAAITSTSETYSMVLMQALACGIPAVGVKARALAEYIKPEIGFLVPPGDSSALAKEVIKIFTQLELAKTLGTQAIEYVKQFGAEAVALRWEKLYTSLI